MATAMSPTLTSCLAFCANKASISLIAVLNTKIASASANTIFLKRVAVP